MIRIKEKINSESDDLKIENQTYLIVIDKIIMQNYAKFIADVN